jgi:hypothetical protein
MVKRSVQWLISTCLLVMTPGHAIAITAIIYQPHQADIALPESTWPAVFASVRQQGFDTVVFQWTQHGSAFTSLLQQQWLERRVVEATTYDLNLVIGLYADPEGAASLKIPTELIGAYAREVTKRSTELALHWRSLIAPARLVGWYLPFEIDDHQWRSQDMQSELILWNKRQAIALKQVANIPIYQSAFSTGNATPKQFANLLRTINAQTGVRLWIQDGKGTGALLPTEAQAYLQAMTVCSDPVVAGVIYELFMQTGPDRAFKANPLARSSLVSSLKKRAPCQGDSLFFSLRYWFKLGQ